MTEAHNGNLDPSQQPIRGFEFRAENVGRYDPAFDADTRIAERQYVHGRSSGEMYTGAMSTEQSDWRYPLQSLVGVISVGESMNYGIVDTQIGKGENAQPVRMVTKIGAELNQASIVGFVTEKRRMPVILRDRRGREFVNFSVYNSYKEDTLAVENKGYGTLQLGSAERPQKRFTLRSAFRGLVRAFTEKAPQNRMSDIVASRGWIVPAETIKDSYDDFIAYVQEREARAAEEGHIWPKQ